MSKRGSWPQRLVCKRRGHVERAYRRHGNIVVGEPHCARCGVSLPGYRSVGMPDPNEDRWRGFTDQQIVVIHDAMYAASVPEFEYRHAGTDEDSALYRSLSRVRNEREGNA